MPPNKETSTSVPQRALDCFLKALKRCEAGEPLMTIFATADADGLTRNLLLTYYRNKGVVDYLCLLPVKHGKIRRRLKDVIRFGVLQIHYLEGMPPPLVVDTCVFYVKKRFGKRDAGFVNAVLRQIATYSVETLVEELRKKKSDVNLNVCDELATRWKLRWGYEKACRFSETLKKQASLTLRLKKGHCIDDSEPFLKPVKTVHGTLSYCLKQCDDPAKLFASNDFRSGAFYIQDAATLLAPSILDVQPGETVVDVCGAPGGKALILQEQLEGRGLLVVMDLIEKRLQQVCENLAPLNNVAIVEGDATLPPFADKSIDAVLLDVPCSNTGVIRRRPDVRWHFSEEKLADLVATQKAILQAAWRSLRPGGRVVYSTCSIEREENECLIRSFLENESFAILEYERLLMPCERHDGGFVALVRKNA
jgi:16S rRNA (cytosine967-C5)-methyltransferase